MIIYFSTDDYRALDTAMSGQTEYLTHPFLSTDLSIWREGLGVATGSGTPTAAATRPPADRCWSISRIRLGTN